MSSETTMVAEQFRLQEWAAQIRDCKNRPTGISVVSWCASHGITKTNYYYRLRRARESCLETIQEETPGQQIVALNDTTCFKAVYIVCNHRRHSWYFERKLFSKDLFPVRIEMSLYETKNSLISY